MMCSMLFPLNMTICSFVIELKERNKRKKESEKIHTI